MEIKYCGNCRHKKKISYPMIIPPYVKCRTKENPFFINYCSERNKLIDEIDLLTYVNPPCKYWEEKKKN